MNNIIYFISKHKYTLLLLFAGILFLIAPMSTKEEKLLIAYLIGFVLLIFSFYYFFKNWKKK